ncbi:MAG: insulinase family protein, partial [Treponema sp.]|nr:insulinase family protein [Treponema sp.]
MFDFFDSKNIGQAYKGFTLLSIDDIPDYKAKGLFLRHKRTGLEVYHIVKDDKENLFAFAFRTVSKDSLGTAHIMEHSTLCGSEKYPLKEPFSTLVSTSLNTFLNALTYPDKTVYPGASLVRDDYFNMMDVYADAVFFPKLDHATFIQEGHRLEMDDKGKLSIQGVVYNEMKGNYSSFSQVAFSEQINAMFPDSYPAFDSGGDPLEIPNLTYQAFLDFHQKFYNPDNCLLFLYGDIPTADQLDFFNERFISRIEKKYNCTKDVENADSKLPLRTDEIKNLMELKLQPQSKEVRALVPDTGATGNFVTMSWYTGSINIEKYFLSEVIAGNDSSPLSKALKESGLGDEVNCGNFGQFDQEFYTAGLWGVKPGNENKVYALIEKTIKDLYEKGISQEDIDSAVMGIDFALREVNRYWGPPSIQIMEKTLKGWTIGNPCPSQLTPITSFEGLKKELKKDPEYTRKLIKKYFIDQKVVVKFVAEASPEFFKKRNKAEADLIKKLEASLDKEALKKDLDELHAYQQHVETPEETSCIPTTKLSSLDPKIDIPQIEIKSIKGSDNSDIPLFVSKEDTNGLFYIDLLFPFDRLEPEYLQYLPFLSSVITNMGWNGKKWNDCIAQSACIMGDVWGRLCKGILSDCQQSQEFISQYKDYNFCGRQWLGLSCKALTSMAQESLDLLSQIVTTMSFDDEKRLTSLIGELKSEKKVGLVSGGRDYAVKRSCALWSVNQALSEIFWGLSQFQTIKEYTKEKPGKILKTFEYIYKECLKS